MKNTVLKHNSQIQPSIVCSKKPKREFFGRLPTTVSMLKSGQKLQGLCSESFKDVYI